MDTIKSFLATTAGKIIAAVVVVGGVVGATMAINPQFATTMQNRINAVMPIGQQQITKEDLVLMPSNVKSVEFKYVPPKMYSFLGLQGKVFTDESKLSQVKISVDTSKLSKEFSQQLGLSFFGVEIRSNNKAAYVHFDIRDAQKALDMVYAQMFKGADSEQVAQVRSLAITQKIEKLAKGESWIKITQEYIQNLADSASKGKVDIKAKRLTKEEATELMKAFKNSYSINVVDSKFNLDGKTYTKIAIQLDRQGLIKDLNALKNNKTLMDKLGLKEANIDESLDKIKRSEDAMIWTKPIVYVYGKKQGSFKAYRIEFVIPVGSKEIAKMEQSYQKSKKDSSLSQFPVIADGTKEMLEQGKKNGYVSLGYLEFFNYDKATDVETPSNVILFKELVQDASVLMQQTQSRTKYSRPTPPSGYNMPSGYGNMPSGY